MWKWLNPHSYPSIVLFFAMAIYGGIFAWSSFNLIHLAMENFRFLRQAGAFAIMEGGLWQLAEIIFSALVSLVCYLAFKICETEIVYRFRSWSGRSGGK